MPPVTDTVCSDVTTLPSDIQPWVQLQCSVDDAVFGDEWVASSAYYVEGDVLTGGGVKLKTYDHREADLTVVFAHEVKVPATETTPDAESLVPKFVVGRMKGSVGSLPVFGVAFNQAGYGGGDQTVFSVLGITDEETLEAYSTMVRTLAAEVRVLSLITLQSKPLSQTSLTAAELMASDSDLSQLLTMSASLGNAPPTGSEPDAECIKRAYEDHALDIAEANDFLAVCMVLAMAAFLAGVAICSGPIVFPVPGAAISAACFAKLLAAQVGAMATCAATHAVQVKWANARLRLALSRCGVNIYES